MSSFLKSIFHSSNKHKKLSEEWTSSREPVVDGVTFYVRYLGSSLVEDPKCAQSTTAGVKRVIHAAKAGARRPERVAFRVAMEGVRIDSTITGETIMDTSIYKISYCSADSQYEQILAFVASNEDDRCECHAFLCSKRKVAEAIAVSIAQAFTMAYECWKRAVEAKKNGETSLTSEENADRGEACQSQGGCSKGDGNNSRASSPEHSPGYSSPPSEVSSTSGYQSSTACGLLLELDYGDSGSGGVEVSDHAQRQANSEAARPREHWTSFDDVSELADDMVRLNLGPALNCFPTTVSTATTTTLGNYLPANLRGNLLAQTTRAQVFEKAEGSASQLYEVAANAPSVGISAVASTPSPLTQSSNSSLLQTEKILGAHFPPASHVSNDTCRNVSRLQYFTPAGSYSTASQREANVYKSSVPSFPDAMQTSPKGSGASKSDIHEESARDKSWVDFEKTGLAGTNGEQQGFSDATSNVKVPRSRWECFDSSPPSRPTSPLGLSLPSKCSLDLPIDSSSPNTLFLQQSGVHEDSRFSSKLDYQLSSQTSVAGRPALPDPLHGAMSPITAFLDSCLTPRSDREHCEKKFEFSGRLSGEERNFSSDFNSVPSQSSSNGKFLLQENQSGAVSKSILNQSVKVSSNTFLKDMASVQNGQKNFPELVR